MSLRNFNCYKSVGVDVPYEPFIIVPICGRPMVAPTECSSLRRETVISPLFGRKTPRTSHEIRGVHSFRIQHSAFCVIAVVRLALCLYTETKQNAKPTAS